MKLSFYGGAMARTGQCYLLEVDNQNILIDCGFQQGYDEYNNNALDFYSSRIDHVLVTDAHVDSTGRLPLLIQEGYYGKIITTPTTKKLMNSILKERADHHVNDANWRNQKGMRTGVSPMQPLFSMFDVVSTMQQVETEPFHQIFTLCPGVKARFVPSGHMIGAASIELWATEEGETRKIVFSGDLGCKEIPYASPPTKIPDADYVIIGAPYGDTVHKEVKNLYNYTELAETIDMTLSNAGNVVMSANIIGRTQEILFALAQIKKEKLVKGMPHFKVYLDSFLADEAVKILEGDPTLDLGAFGVSGDYQGENNPFLFEDLVLCKTQEESKALNRDLTPKVIIAGSGMSDRGRMKHHLKQNLWRRECTFIQLGSLGIGSLGRRLKDGLTSCRIFGEDVIVRCHISQFEGNPSHADKPQLLDWLSHFEEKPQHIFVTHGQDATCERFSETLQGEGYEAHAPFPIEIYDLITNQISRPGIVTDQKGNSFSVPYILLQDAVRDLSRTVAEGRWHSGEEFEEMTAEIRAIIAHWNAQDPHHPHL